MKTATVTNSTTTNSRRCERNSLLSLFSLFCQRVHGHCIHAKKILLNLGSARVEQGLRAGLSALRLSMTTPINLSLFVAIGIMGVVAPLVSCVYLLFDRKAFDGDWFHVNYFHLFLELGPFIFLLTCLVGIFFLFPQGSKRAYLLAIPQGFVVGKILWLIQCSTNEEYWALPPIGFIFQGAVISIVLFIALDYLTWRKFHRQDAFEARLDKLIELADDFDDAKFKSMVKSVWREKREFQKQF